MAHSLSYGVDEQHSIAEFWAKCRTNGIIKHYLNKGGREKHGFMVHRAAF